MADSGSILESQVDFAKSIFASDARILVITGPGLSDESGVPRFPANTASAEEFSRDPRGVWERHTDFRRAVSQCEPSAAHLALGAWARRRGEAVTVVTQCVDDLHERAGLMNVRYAHGCIWKNRCVTCGRERRDESLVYDKSPRSSCCFALERPAVVWPQEMLAQDVTHDLLRDFNVASVIFAIGTAGVVNPLALFLQLARDTRRLAISVNAGPVPYTTDIDFRAYASEFLPQLLDVD